jgi:hypothetical protein
MSTGSHRSDRRKFVVSLTDPDCRRHALEYLTLAPFVHTDIRLTEANQVRAFFAACGTRSLSDVLWP